MDCENEYLSKPMYDFNTSKVPRNLQRLAAAVNIYTYMYYCFHAKSLQPSPLAVYRSSFFCCRSISNPILFHVCNNFLYFSNPPLPYNSVKRRKERANEKTSVHIFFLTLLDMILLFSIFLSSVPPSFKFFFSSKSITAFV